MSARSGGGSARFFPGSDNEFGTPRLQTGSARSGYNSARAESKYDDDGDESDRYLEGLQEKQTSYQAARMAQERAAQQQQQQQYHQPPPTQQQQTQHYPTAYHETQSQSSYDQHQYPPTHSQYPTQHQPQYPPQSYAPPTQTNYSQPQGFNYAEPQHHQEYAQPTAHTSQQYSNYNPPAPSHPAPQHTPVYYEEPDPYAQQQHHTHAQAQPQYSQQGYDQGYQSHGSSGYHQQPQPPPQHQQHQQQYSQYAESKEERDFQERYHAPSEHYSAEAKQAPQEQYDVDDQAVEDIFSYARHNRLSDVENLLDRGVPVNVRDQYGNTILSISCQNGHKRIMKCALRRGGDINTVNYKGNSPLHFAFKYGFGATLGAYLISKGADVSIRNHDGLLFSEEG
ncbi:hypothetical protein TL16_g00471 [Triparma laevis f. inornata]|nr:hypothetical protein TL16_g00471 [Triparma laevis f. inornata]